MADVFMEIILPQEEFAIVSYPSEPLSKREMTVVVPVEERMRGWCWKLKAEDVGKSMSVKEENLPFRRHIIEPS